MAQDGRGLLESFSFLPYSDLALSCCLVSHHWLAATLNDQIWPTFVDQFGFCVPSELNLASWRLAFIAQIRCQVIGVLRPTHVLLYSPSRHTFTKVNTATCQSASSLLLWPKKLLACGGSEHGLAYFSTAQVIDLATGASVTVCNMTIQRAYHGLAELCGAVYAFGGTNGAYLKSAEKLDLETWEWRQVGDMTNARLMFHPAVWKHKAYLCGGFSGAAETFDPASGEYSCINLNLNGAGACLARVFRGVLCVVSTEGVWEWTEAGSKKLAARGGWMWSSISPGRFGTGEFVVGDEKVYMLDWVKKEQKIVCRTPP